MWETAINTSKSNALDLHTRSCNASWFLAECCINGSKWADKSAIDFRVLQSRTTGDRCHSNHAAVPHCCRISITSRTVKLSGTRLISSVNPAVNCKPTPALVSMLMCYAVHLSEVLTRLLWEAFGWQFSTTVWQPLSFSALTLLVGWQEGHLACKNWAVGCWHGYVSGSRCRFAYGPADAIATHYLLLQ